MCKRRSAKIVYKYLPLWPVPRKVVPEFHQCIIKYEVHGICRHLSGIFYPIPNMYLCLANTGTYIISHYDLRKCHSHINHLIKSLFSQLNLYIFFLFLVKFTIVSGIKISYKKFLNFMLFI